MMAIDDDPSPSSSSSDRQAFHQCHIITILINVNMTNIITNIITIIIIHCRQETRSLRRTKQLVVLLIVPTILWWRDLFVRWWPSKTMKAINLSSIIIIHRWGWRSLTRRGLQGGLGTRLAWLRSGWFIPKVIFMSSISQVRQGQSEEERAARQQQNRAHMTEVDIWAIIKTKLSYCFFFSLATFLGKSEADLRWLPQGPDTVPVLRRTPLAQWDVPSLLWKRKTLQQTVWWWSAAHAGPTCRHSAYAEQTIPCCNPAQ